MPADPTREGQPAAAPARAVLLRRSRKRDGLRNRVEFHFLTHYPSVWRGLQAMQNSERLVNRYLIDRAATKAPPRPYRLSTMSHYTSWASLTDRSYNARQLPPTACVRTDPPDDQVAAMFTRRGHQRECPKSTVLFAYFAQWFTDGFLRSQRAAPPASDRDITFNKSNHEVDLCQLYGLKDKHTDMLRLHHSGLLKSTIINGQEFPKRLCDDRARIKPEFVGLRVLGFDGLTNDQKRKLFAMGSDVANAQLGYAMFNVLFLREHNRIARQLATAHETWDDERLFSTARNILTVLLIRLAIEEYINHIAPYHFKFKLRPESFDGSSWYRPNWESVEFNLLYRWHPLIPTELAVAGERLPIEQTTFRNDLLTDRGLGALFADASAQPAGEIGLFNTAAWFDDRTSLPSVRQSRAVKLASYNDYRALVKLPRITDFDQISSRAEVRQALREAYDDDVDKIEFYVGLFAEDRRENSALPPLMGTLVGVHAFSQLMTNPLLAPNVYVETTFSTPGWAMVRETDLTLEKLLRRNSPKWSPAYPARLTREGWKRR
jgi:prostaglandin-endoperoxide synthase 2